MTAPARHFRWDDLPWEQLNPQLDRRLITADRIMLAHVHLKKGCVVPRHSHENEQLTYILSGALHFWLGEDEKQEVIVRAGEVLAIPSHLPHKAMALEDTLEEAAEMQGEIERMHTLWRSGDDRALFEATGAELKAEYPALYNRLNRDRNLAWLPRLRAMLDDESEDETLVVVGALHLLGEDGVVELLRAKGYRVERL